MRRIAQWSVLLVLAVLCAAVLFTPAAAEGSGKTYTEWKDELLSLRRFTFQRHKEGIGLGDCPVYTAPSKDALRMANGRAAVDTNKDFYEGGKTEEGWLLIRYEPKSGITRVGYIPPSYLKNFKSPMSARGFGNVSAVAANTIQVTDNPVQADGNVFATLNEGESFRIVGKYTYHGNWWYIECTAEGKIARGFISRDKSSFYPGADVQDNMNQVPLTMDTLGTPSISPTGNQQIGEIVIKGTTGDERKRVHRDPGLDSKQVTVVYPTRHYPCYGTEDLNGKPWYYIFVEEDSVWGWVTSEVSTFNAQ